MQKMPYRNVSLKKRETKLWGFSARPQWVTQGERNVALQSVGCLSYPILPASTPEALGWCRQGEGQSRAQASTVPSLLQCSHLCENGTNTQD